MRFLVRSVQLQVLPRSFGVSVVKNEASYRTAGVSEARIVSQHCWSQLVGVCVSLRTFWNGKCAPRLCGRRGVEQICNSGFYYLTVASLRRTPTGQIQRTGSGYRGQSNEFEVDWSRTLLHFLP